MQRANGQLKGVIDWALITVTVVDLDSNAVSHVNKRIVIITLLIVRCCALTAMGVINVSHVNKHDLA